MEKGFATTNIVFGIGSYSYQYHTRDTFGFAVKATAATVNGEERALFKDPKTDDGTKRSQRGRVAVAYSSQPIDITTLTGDQSNNSLLWIDGLDTTSQAEYEKDGWDALQVVYSNGKLTKETTLADIREKLQ